MAYPDQGYEVTMAPRLGEDTMARIDQNNCCVRRRRASNHVPRILFMARSVSNDEFTAVRREEPIGNVNRDTLLPLGSKAVYEKREIQVVTLGPKFLRIPGERSELIFE